MATAEKRGFEEDWREEDDLHPAKHSRKDGVFTSNRKLSFPSCYCGAL